MNDLGLSDDEKKQKEEQKEEPIEDDTFSILKTITKKIGNNLPNDQSKPYRFKLNITSSKTP
jgi:hypothetical protein